MGLHPDHFRLALTAFDDVKVVMPTIVELIGAGLGLEQFCLIGPADVMANFAAADAGFDGHLDHAANLHEAVEPWPGSADGSPIVATSGPVLEAILRSSAGADPISQVGITTKQILDLERQMRAGSVVLVVKSLDHKQQRLATRTLLAKSEQRVTTYGFLLPKLRDRPSRD